MSLIGVGLEDDEVRVVGYNASWPLAFETLAAPLREHLPGARIEHVGSTSVPSLSAKPLIDISVGIAIGSFLSVATADQCGLTFRAVNPESVLFAIFDRPTFRIANVHVRYRGAESERWDILFRDYLRANPGRVAEYREAKETAAATVEGRGRSRYSDTKGPFIRALIDEVEDWATASGWSLAP